MRCRKGVEEKERGADSGSGHSDRACIHRSIVRETDVSGNALGRFSLLGGATDAITDRPCFPKGEPQTILIVQMLSYPGSAPLSSLTDQRPEDHPHRRQPPVVPFRAFILRSLPVRMKSR